MSAAELSRLAAAIDNERATRAVRDGTADEGSIARLWHEAITDNFGAMDYMAWIRGPGKHATKHLRTAEGFVPKFFRRPPREESMYFARLIMVSCLGDYLRSINVTPTTSVVTKNLGSIVSAVDHALPGYERSGMLPLAYDRFCSQR